MSRTGSSARALALALAGLTIMSACSNDTVTNSISPLNTFNMNRLVSDETALGAGTTDGNLVNPWGLAFGSSGLLWVANNGTGTSTVYDGSGNKNALTVTIPSAALLTAGTPTGMIFNSSSDFGIGGGPALFIFAGEDGTISAWNQSSGNNASILVDRSGLGAVYKGIASASINGTTQLYATDFFNGHVDVFNAQFNFLTSFTDPNMVVGYAPFGIQNINGRLYVTFAKQQGPANHDDEAGVGNGFVDVFNTDGTLSGRFASNGTLNSPWGVAMTPTNFGPFAGDILVGNFGDGHIGVYDVNGHFIDMLRDASSNELAIDGLWSLTFGPGVGSTSLYFSSGPNSESHGLVGTVTPK